MAGPCPNLSPENWQAAYLVLTGEVGFKATKGEAAAAAGVTVRELMDWVRRSRERLPDDEPWVWEIAEQFDRLHESRAEFLRGVAWERAVHGVDTPVIFRGEVMNETVKKVDNAVLLRLLEVYDPEFRAAKLAQKNGKEPLPSDEEPEDLFRRLLASIRMKQINAEHEQRSIPAPPVMIGAPAEPASQAQPAPPPPPPSARRNLEVPSDL